MWLTNHKNTTIVVVLCVLQGSAAMSLSSRKACKKSKQLKSKSQQTHSGNCWKFTCRFLKKQRQLAAVS